MIRNYLKTACRSLRKNTGFTSINVLGLSIGLGILEWLGLGVLAVYIGSGLADVAKDLDAGAQMAWTSGGSATQIDAAARRMAGRLRGAGGHTARVAFARARPAR